MFLSIQKLIQADGWCVNTQLYSTKYYNKSDSSVLLSLLWTDVSMGAHSPHIGDCVFVFLHVHVYVNVSTCIVLYEVPLRRTCISISIRWHCPWWPIDNSSWCRQLSSHQHCDSQWIFRICIYSIVPILPFGHPRAHWMVEQTHIIISLIHFKLKFEFVHSTIMTRDDGILLWLVCVLFLFENEKWSWVCDSRWERKRVFLFFF